MNVERGPRWEHSTLEPAQGGQPKKVHEAKSDNSCDRAQLTAPGIVEASDEPQLSSFILHNS